MTPTRSTSSPPTSSFRTWCPPAAPRPSSRRTRAKPPARRRDTAGVTADRVAACRELAVQTGAIVVLKGAGTVISMRSPRTWINPTGSPMLAHGRLGDVLAGMIGAMFAQGYDMVESVLAAVYFHGLSAEGLEAGFTAGEIAPNAMALVHDARVSYDLDDRTACFTTPPRNKVLRSRTSKTPDVQQFEQISTENGNYILLRTMTQGKTSRSPLPVNLLR